MRNHSLVEYIWVDGTKGTAMLRSKTKVFTKDATLLWLDSFPWWSFDGSSTQQATGDNSDCLLKPVKKVTNPDGGVLLLCEVYVDKDTPHPSNTRAKLRATMDKLPAGVDPWIGYEQEYVLMRNETILGWPEKGFPTAQGPFYCGVGGENVNGREISEEHMEVCLNYGLQLYGTNAEVMLGQWEYQIGPRAYPVLAVKPKEGDWNGSGMHTNFSTSLMRDVSQGRGAIEQAINRLGRKHDEHIAVYGADLEKRLTGRHETCSIHEFRAGVSDRGASIRIPKEVAAQGYGYIEDRRPGANADPYQVAEALVRTICLA